MHDRAGAVGMPLARSFFSGNLEDFLKVKFQVIDCKAFIRVDVSGSRMYNLI
jgi:hypothetical protein